MVEQSTLAGVMMVVAGVMVSVGVAFGVAAPWGGGERFVVISDVMTLGGVIVILLTLVVILVWEVLDGSVAKQGECNL